MIDFKKSDFDNMMVPIHKKPPEADVFEWMPSLKLWTEWREAKVRIKKATIIEYIIYVYDRYSPFRNKFPDVVERKLQVARYLGFPQDDKGQFTADYQRVMHSKHQDVVQMVIRYVREHRSTLFTFVVAAEQEYYRELRRMLTGEDSDKKHLMKKMQQDLDDAILELFNKDNSEVLEKDLFKYVEQEQLELRPEHIAEKLQNDREPVAYEDVSES